MKGAGQPGTEVSRGFGKHTQVLTLKNKDNGQSLLWAVKAHR